MDCAACAIVAVHVGLSEAEGLSCLAEMCPALQVSSSAVVAHTRHG